MESPQSPHSSSFWVFALSHIEFYCPLLPIPISHLGTKLSSTVLVLLALGSSQEGTPPPAQHEKVQDNWSPFSSQSSFLVTDFLFHMVEMSAPSINFLMELWAFDVMKHRPDATSPFVSHYNVYSTIDEIRAGGVPWKCLSVNCTDNNLDSPLWKQQEYQVWYQDPDMVIKNMLDNVDFDGQINYAPHAITDTTGKQRWKDFMSGNYAWRKAVSRYPATVYLGLESLIF